MFGAIVHFGYLYSWNWIDSSSTSSTLTINCAIEHKAIYNNNVRLIQFYRLKSFFFYFSLSCMFFGSLWPLHMDVSMYGCVFSMCVPCMTAWLPACLCVSEVFYELFWLLSFTVLWRDFFSLFSLYSSSFLSSSWEWHLLESCNCVTNQLENELLNNNNRSRNWKYPLNTIPRTT